MSEIFKKTSAEKFQLKTAIKEFKKSKRKLNSTFTNKTSMKKAFHTNLLTELKSLVDVVEKTAIALAH